MNTETAKKKSITAPIIALLLVVIGMCFQLLNQGRSWLAKDGSFKFWISDAWGGDNSQQLLDPYSFSHILHGMLFFGALYLLRNYLSLAWRFVIAIALEAAWEIAENTQTVIDRYRESTAALGYYGDTITNCLGDLISCGIGFAIAYYLGFWKSLALFIFIEIALILTIKDSLLINIIMIIYPLDAIKEWQTAMMLCL